MRKSGLHIGLTVLIVLAAFGSAGADSSHKEVDHSGHVGDRIHASVVDDYNLAYHILDLPGKKERHLMVYIQSPEGEAVTGGKVGYLITGPDGTTQKVMAMAMKEAFGGDVNFTATGSYTIKMKAVLGEQKLLDTFRFTVP